MGVLQGHSDAVLCVRPLPRHAMLASGSHDGTIRLWNEQGKCVRVLDHHQCCVRSLVVLPEGRLCSGGCDGAVCIWSLDWESQTTTKNAAATRATRSGTIAPLRVLTGHKGAITSLACLKDGRLVTGSRDKTGRISTWYTERGLTTVLGGSKSTVNAVAGLSDGRVATGSDGASVRVYSADGQCLHSMRGHHGKVQCLTSLPDGKLASGACDRTVRVWSATGECERVLQGHRGHVCALACHEDGRVVSGSADHTVQVWPSAVEHVESSLPQDEARNHTANAGKVVTPITTPRRAMTDEDFMAMLSQLESRLLPPAA